MLLLAFDTATPAVTAAVHDTDGAATLAAADQVDGRRHGELLLPTIDQVLRAAGVGKEQLGALVVGTGPGPYTGLRVGLATAAALGHALGIPVHGVCTLDGIAHAARAAGLTGPFTVATDARRKEVYWARYDAAGRRADGPHAGHAGAIPDAVGLPVAGAGGPLYPEAFGELIAPVYPDAGTLCGLVAQPAGQVPLLAPEPLYLRRPDAREPGPPKRVTPS